MSSKYSARPSTRTCACTHNTQHLALHGLFMYLQHGSSFYV